MRRPALIGPPEGSAHVDGTSHTHTVDSDVFRASSSTVFTDADGDHDAGAAMYREQSDGISELYT